MTIEKCPIYQCKLRKMFYNAQRKIQHFCCDRYFDHQITIKTSSNVVSNVTFRGQEDSGKVFNAFLKVTSLALE